MYMHDKHNEAGKAGAFLAGALATAAIGGYLLYGPQGRRNRKKVEEWVDQAKDGAEDMYESARDKAEGAVDEVMDTYDAAKDLGEDKAEQIGTAIKKRWRQVGNAARKAKRAAEDELSK